MKRYCILMIFLSGCTPIFLTDPALVRSPSTAADKERYDRDYAECKREITPSVLDMGSSLMGPIGVVAAESSEGKLGDAFKSSYTLRDECLKRKGYALRD